jgi:hypothetical protein
MRHVLVSFLAVALLSACGKVKVLEGGSAGSLGQIRDAVSVGLSDEVKQAVSDLCSSLRSKDNNFRGTYVGRSDKVFSFVSTQQDCNGRYLTHGANVKEFDNTATVVLNGSGLLTYSVLSGPHLASDTVNTHSAGLTAALCRASINQGTAMTSPVMISGTTAQWFNMDPSACGATIRNGFCLQLQTGYKQQESGLFKVSLNENFLFDFTLGSTLYGTVVRYSRHDLTACTNGRKTLTTVDFQGVTP